ncbi:MAG: histidine kinase [Acidobacteria bacterium]|nr:histidine kinase [Acidobacteriota bacterium]
MRTTDLPRRLGQAGLVLLAATAFGLANAVHSPQMFRPDSWRAWWEVAGPQLLRAWLFAGLFPPAVLFCHFFPLSRPRRRGAIAIHVCGGTLLVSLSLLAYSATAGLPLPDTIVFFWRLHLIGYAMVLAAAAGLDASRRARAEELRDAELRTRLAAARLETLRSQIHPHFIFNTLNGILPLVDDDPPAAVKAVGSLAGLFRESLSEGTGRSDVAAEVSFLERYLSLLKIRFGERLEYTLEVAPGAGRGSVPRLLLQPLVENAVQHGLSQRPEGGRVEVEARRGPGTLVLEVRDDGSGLNGSPSREAGLGLANTRARLAALHGDRFSFALGPRPGGGVVARIELPYEEAS